MKKPLSIFLFVFMLSCFFQNCKRDICDSVDQYPVTKNYVIADSNMSKIPFTGIDTLIFLNDSGDSAIFIGQGKKRYTISNTSSVGNDCPKKITENNDNFEIKYKGSNLNFSALNYLLFSDASIPKNYTGFKLIFNNSISILTSFELATIYLPVQDSIYLNGQYAVGGYIFTDKTTLYSKQFGLLKFRIYNETWVKIK